MKKIICVLLLFFTTFFVFADSKELKYQVKASGTKDFEKCQLWLVDLRHSTDSTFDFISKDLGVIRYTDYWGAYCYNIEVRIINDTINIRLFNNTITIGGNITPSVFKESFGFDKYIFTLRDILSEY